MLNSILSLTKQLISVPSVTSDIASIEEVFQIAKKELNEFSVRSFKNNDYPSLLYTNVGKEINDFRIILNAHLDVVPAPLAQFEPKEQGGKLYGRGSYDMKAAAAVMVVLFKEISRKVHYPLALQIVSDEEDSSMYGTQYQIKQGIKAKFVISGEGTNLKIINNAKGQITIKLTAKGKSSHSGYPWRGENAIAKMNKAIEKIQQQYATPAEEYFGNIVHVTGIHSNNTSYNNIPDHCEAYVDIRFMSEEDQIIEDIRSLVEPLVTVDVLVVFPRNDTPSDHPDIQLLRKESSGIVKEELALGFAHGASDIAFFKEVGCDGIEFGPKGGNHHGNDEWVDIQSLEDYYHILKNFLLSVQKL